MWLVTYLRSLLYVFYDVFFQKLYMKHLGKTSAIGDSVRGYTAIVTGPTSGIGKETALALARKGAHVILACRSLERGEAVKKEILDSCKDSKLPLPKVEIKKLDLASLASVRTFALSWNAERRPLHILVNNAGVYLLGGVFSYVTKARREETENGFEMHMGANHLGHFLLSLSLLPSLQQAATANPEFTPRIVNVSSALHTLVPGMRISDPHMKLPGAYNAESAYAQSKLAQVLFTRELRRRLAQRGGPAISVVALHPGMVLSEITKTLPAFMRAMQKLLMSVVLLTPEEGARASVYCATSAKVPKQAEASAGYFTSTCMPASPSSFAQDDTMARWCWRWSVQQVALPADLDLQD